MTFDLVIKRTLQMFSPKKGGGTCTPPLARPMRDWELLLLCTAIAFIGVAVWSGLVYFEAKNGGVDPTVDTGRVKHQVSFDESALTRVLTLQGARAKLHAERVKGL